MCLCVRRSGRTCACVLEGVGDHVYMLGGVGIMYLCYEEWTIMCLYVRRSGRSCACVLGGVGDHVFVC